MQKNDLVTVAIEDIGVGGEGIGKVDGYTLFIKDAIIGDVVSRPGIHRMSGTALSSRPMSTSPESRISSRLDA